MTEETGRPDVHPPSLLVTRVLEASSQLSAPSEPSSLIEATRTSEPSNVGTNPDAVATADDADMRQELQARTERDRQAAPTSSSAYVLDAAHLLEANSAAAPQMLRDQRPQGQQDHTTMTRSLLQADEGAKVIPPTTLPQKVSSIGGPSSSSRTAEEANDDAIEEDGGVIRCICSLNDDDGFTIQCDRCLVWQHCACFGMSSDSVPDEYLCELCDPRPVDVAFARAVQQSRRDEELHKAKATGRQSQSYDSMSMVSYQAQIPAGGDIVVEDIAAPKLSPEGPEQPKYQHQRAHSSSHKSRKMSQNIDLSNTGFNLPDAPLGPDGPSKARKKPGPKPGSRRTPLATPTSATTPKVLTFPPIASPAATALAREDRTVEDDALTSTDKLDAWHLEFTRIRQNLITEGIVCETLAASVLEHSSGTAAIVAAESEDGHLIAPLATCDATETDSIDQVSVGHALKQTPGRAVDGSRRFHNLGLSPISNECVPIVIHAPSLMDVACDVYVKSISETAASAIFTNVLYIPTLPYEKARSWSASRSFSKPVMHGLFAESTIPAGAFISEFRGELLSAESYRNDPINQYKVLGTTKTHVHLFPPPLSLAIDARRFGTEARFARFGCHPNAVIRPVLFYPTAVMSGQSEQEVHTKRSRDDSPLYASLSIDQAGEPGIRFGLFALEEISKSHEIILGWEWDDQHIVHFLPEIIRNPALETSTKTRSATTLDMASKGDFPYSTTLFAEKMNAATTALLGTSFCGCIGSATPQGGSNNGSASSHNARKQDCAVAQMLRVGQGMGLLNVNIPGSARNSHRRVRPPNFCPLVGIRRWWRGLSMPLTPPSCVDHDIKDNLSVRDILLESGQLPAKIAQGGKVLRFMDQDVEDAVARLELQRRQSVMNRDAPLRASHLDIADGEEEGVMVDDDSMHTDDDVAAISDASSLTEPLEGLSDLDSAESAEESILLDIGRGLVPAGNESDSPTILPLKKRIAGTRLKANHILADDPDREDKTNPRNARKAERAAATVKARAAKAAKRRMSIPAARKGKYLKSKMFKHGNVGDMDGSSDLSSEGNADEFETLESKTKRQQKHGLKVSSVQPSSPLSSASDQDGSDHNSMGDSNLASLYRTASSHTAKLAPPETLQDSDDDDMSTGSEPIRPAYKGRSRSQHSSGPREGRAQAAINLAKESGKQKSPASFKQSKDAKKRARSRTLDATPSESGESEQGSVILTGAKRTMSQVDMASAKRSKRQRSDEMETEASADRPHQGDELVSESLKTSLTVDPSAADGSSAGSIDKSTTHGDSSIALSRAEPEKPRARLSLADWKKQQAEKRKAAAEAATNTAPSVKTEPAVPSPLFEAPMDSQKLPSDFTSPSPVSQKMSLPAAQVPPPPLLGLSGSTRSYADLDSSMAPSTLASTPTSFPPAPLPSRFDRSSPSAATTQLLPTCSTQRSENLPAPLRSASVSADVASPSTPLPPLYRSADAATESASPAPGPPPPHPHAPSRKSTVSPWQSRPSPVISSSVQRPLVPPDPPTPRTAGVPGSGDRDAISRSTGSSAVSPPSGSSFSQLPASPPASHQTAMLAGRGGWGSRGNFAGNAQTSMGPPTSSALDGDGSPANSIAASASTRSSSRHTAAASASATSPIPVSPAKELSSGVPPLGPSLPASVTSTAVGRERAEMTVPNFRGSNPRRTSSIGSASAAVPPATAPAGPAAFRTSGNVAHSTAATGSSTVGGVVPSGHIPSGPSSNASAAAPFNPPKGPKALMTPSAPQAPAATTGSNAISIRGGGGSAGFAPVDTVGPRGGGAGPPAGPKGASIGSGSEGGSPPAVSSAMPQRHLSIMGRGAAAAAATSFATGTGATPADHIYSPGAALEKSLGTGSAAPFAGVSGGFRGGGRGMAHLGHGGGFPRGGGWGGRGGRGGGPPGGPLGGPGGTGSNTGAGSGHPGSGWAGRGRGGRGGSMGR